MSDPLIILKTGSTYPEIFAEHGDFEDWMKAGLNLPAEMTQVINAQDLVLSPDNHAAGAVVVTGAVEMVTDHAPWSEAAGEWLVGLYADGIPILGVCYGHQLLAHVLGGDVGYHPGGREIGTVNIHKLPAAQDDPLFGGLPDRVVRSAHFSVGHRNPVCPEKLFCLVFVNVHFPPFFFSTANARNRYKV